MQSNQCYKYQQRHQQLVVCSTYTNTTSQVTPTVLISTVCLLHKQHIGELPCDSAVQY
jgi:hypothetical protein